jgi:hypothetical protein
VQLRNFQFEESSSATAFHAGHELGKLEPAPTSGMGRLYPVWNPGDSWTPLNIYQGNTSATWSKSFVGVLSGPLATDYLNGGALQQIESWTNGTDTAGAVQAGSSPGSGTSAKLTTFATTTLVSRASNTISTSSLLDVLQGRTWRAIVRVVARTATYNGQVRLTATVGQTFIDKTVTITGLTTGTYHEVDFGAVTFPDTALSNINLGLYASRTSGTGNLEWDFLFWAPGNYTTSTSSGSVGTSEFAFHDPTQQQVYEVNSSLLASETFTVEGAVQAWVPPGLSIVYALATHNSVSVGGALGDVQLFRTKMSPRYLG